MDVCFVETQLFAVSTTKVKKFLSVDLRKSVLHIADDLMLQGGWGGLYWNNSSDDVMTNWIGGRWVGDHLRNGWLRNIKSFPNL